MVYQADRQVTLVEVLAEAGGISNDAGDTVIITRLETDPAADSEPPAISSEDAAPTPVPSAKQDDASLSANAPKSTNNPPAPDSVPPASVPVASTAARPSNTSAPDAVPPPIPNTITVNLARILETGDTSSNIVLKPGDVVTVPHAGIVYALGAVTRPGGFVIANDRGQLTTLKLLSLAGGLERTAKSDHAVIVRRDSSGQQHQVEVDLRKVMKFQSEDVRLQPSDILYIPHSAAKQALVKTAELSVAVGSAVLIYRLVR
jgi:protein involved in polysaccharide export with SLBB domain